VADAGVGLTPKEIGFVAAAASAAAAAAEAGRDADEPIEALASLPEGEKLVAAARALREAEGEGERDRFRARVQTLRRPEARLDLGSVHESWVREALASQPAEVAGAVLRALPEETGRRIEAASSTAGAASPAAQAASPGASAIVDTLSRRRGGPSRHRQGLDHVILRRFKARALEGVGAPPPDEDAAREHAFVFGLSGAQLIVLAKELGLRVVALALSAISREELAKLCHGLPPNDSVRLVAAIVELQGGGEVGTEEMRAAQKRYLKLLRASGITRELFLDAGLSYMAIVLAGSLGAEGCRSLAYRFPEAIGRKLLGAAESLATTFDEEAVEDAKERLLGWRDEIIRKGLVPGLMPSRKSGEDGGDGDDEESD